MAFKELIGFYILRKLLGPERARKLDNVARKHAPKTASVIFGIVSVAHTLRLVFDWNIIVAGQQIPTWASVVAIIAAAYLSYSLWPNKRL